MDNCIGALKKPIDNKINSLRVFIFLDVTKVKTFADDKIIEAQIMISVCNRVENIVGKGENVGYQHVLFSIQCFQKASFLGS